MGLSALALVAAPPWHWAAWSAAGVAWIGYVALLDSRPLESGGAARRATPTELIYLAGAVGIAAVFLFYDLSGFTGTLHVWEGSVVRGFSLALLAGKNAETYAAEQLVWQTAVLSEGHASLLYGAPTYALMKAFGFSTWMLRVVSAVSALLTVAVGYGLGRRFFGSVAGVAIAYGVALHTCILFYGRYGTSVAGTLLAVTVLLLCVWVFLDDDRSAWWMTPIVAAVSYVATLGYATGRVVVILLLGFVFAVGFRRPRPRRLAGLGALAAVLVGVWLLYSHYGMQHRLLEVRGEQFFVQSQNPESYAVEFGRRPERVELTDRLALARKVIGATIPQYLFRILPDPHADGLSVLGGEEDRQRLYHAPLLGVLLLGFAQSLRRFRQWRHACLLWWTFGVSGAMLLTTHADTHRLAVLVIPLCMWIGLGVAAGARLMSEARVPSILQHATAAAFVCCVAWALSHQLYFPRVEPPTRALAVLDSINRISGPVLLAGGWHSAEVGWVLLAMAERARREPGARGELLDPVLLHAAANEGSVNPADLERLAQIARTQTVIFAPAERFRPVVPVLQRHGIPVIEEGDHDFPILRTVPGGAGVPQGEKRSS
ncbi:MAG: ArnT family glycosyltransferase [Candidatus Binatia bacterium]